MSEKHLSQEPLTMEGMEETFPFGQQRDAHPVGVSKKKTLFSMPSMVEGSCDKCFSLISQSLPPSSDKGRDVRPRLSGQRVPEPGVHLPLIRLAQLRQALQVRDGVAHRDAAIVRAEQPQRRHADVAQRRY